MQNNSANSLVQHEKAHTTNTTKFTQVEIEKAEMKSVIDKLEFELKILHKSNNQLSVDLLRVKQDLQVNEERMKTEKILLKSQAEKEKDSLIKSYEQVISSVKAESTEKDEQIVKLAEKLSMTEDTTNQQMEEAKEMHEARLSEVISAHAKEIKILHKNYERVLADKEAKFNTAHEQFSMEHQKAIESSTSRSATEMKKLQDEFRMTFSALERKMATEREDLVQAHLKELDDIKSIYEEKLTAVNQHHKAVVEELNKNNKEAADNIQELQQSLDLREEVQTVLATETRETYLNLKKEFQELEARIESFREQLEMYEAEKKALLNQAVFTENSMASLTSKYTQLLGHQNSKQKIHHLEKLKQDILNLRKELADKNLALEKEKKARQKADARVKELSGQKKFDPSEAFKVPENPPALIVTPIAVTKTPKVNLARPLIAPFAADTKEAPKLQRKPLRALGTAFFLSMDDVEKTRSEMEQEKRARFEARRNASSANFESFEVDFGNSSADRRKTLDVPPKLNVTHSRDEDGKKENVNRGLFSRDISGVSVDKMILKNKLKSRPDFYLGI